MSRALKAQKPETVKMAKPKFMISGAPNVGKTWVSLDFPAVYYIDVENGATRPQYVSKLKKAGGVYFGREQGAQDFNTVIEEIITLATVKHDYRTLVIDSFSKLYNTAAAISEEKVGSDFGKDKKEANRPTRKLMRWLENVDMNVILICHAKDKWAAGEVVGTTFDGYAKLEYDLDLWLEVQLRGTQRVSMIRKTRLEGFPLNTSFPWCYEEFAKRYGQEVIERAGDVFTPATPAQLGELNKLLEVVKLAEGEKEKWLSKAGVDEFSDMATDTIQKCIDYLKNQMAKAAA